MRGRCEGRQASGCQRHPANGEPAICLPPPSPAAAHPPAPTSQPMTSGHSSPLDWGAPVLQSPEVQSPWAQALRFLHLPVPCRRSHRLWPRHMSPTPTPPGHRLPPCQGLWRWPLLVDRAVLCWRRRQQPQHREPLPPLLLPTLLLQGRTREAGGADPWSAASPLSPVLPACPRGIAPLLLKVPFRAAWLSIRLPACAGHNGVEEHPGLYGRSRQPQAVGRCGRRRP